MSALKHVIEVIDLLEDPNINGEKVRQFFINKGYEKLMTIHVEEIKSSRGKTDFIKIIIPGEKGKYIGGDAPTLGVIGRLGGISVRPHKLGLVSDADGAIVALATAYKIVELKSRGEVLDGDVIITTHICPKALIKKHKPAEMVSSPIDIFELLKREVDESMDAIISVDATKANNVINHTGFAITPTVKEGWILKVSDDMLNIYMRITGEPPVIVPITMQDILPYPTPVYHINSMMQPWIYTNAPVVGLAITSKTIIPGSATGATNVWILEQATRFIIEVAKEFGKGNIKFYDEEEWKKIISIHGHVKEILKKSLTTLPL